MSAKQGFFLIAITFLLVSTNSILVSREFNNSSTKVELQKQDKSGKLYIVKRNESLRELAGRRDIFNNSFAWPVLFKANRDLIKNKNSKLGGLTIKIPVLLPKEKIKYDKIRDRYFKVTFVSALKKLLKKSKQFLIVTSKDWDSTKANLIYYEKKKGKLQKMSHNISVNLGRTGLGWGNGLIDFNKFAGPIKHEGDGKSPAGIFKLSSAFGYLPIDSLCWLKYQYKQVTTKIECVDDTTSIYYNTLVNSEKITKTWNSSEIMQLKSSAYKFGIFVDHNSNPQIPGCGSCIFIHIWDGFGKPTTGCTSMSEEQIIKLFHWLDAKKKPLLIQLPENEFNKIRFLFNF